MPQHHVLSAFDPTLRYFACISSDNRLKLWDVVTDSLVQEHKEPQHLAISYTSIAYITEGKHTSTHKHSKKTQTSSSSSSSLGYLCVGQKNGTVTIWNLSSGNCSYLTSTTASPQETLADRAHAASASITALHYSPSSSTLFAAAADSTLTTFSVPSFTRIHTKDVNHTIHNLHTLHDNNQEVVVSQGSAIAVLDLSSSSSASVSSVTVKRQYASMSAHIHSLDVSADNKLLLSGAKDRFVSLWDTPAPGSEHSDQKKSHKERKPVRTFALTATNTLATFNQVIQQHTTRCRSIISDQVIYLAEDATTPAWLNYWPRDSTTAIHIDRVGTVLLTAVVLCALLCPFVQHTTTDYHIAALAESHTLNIFHHTRSDSTAPASIPACVISLPAYAQSALNAQHQRVSLQTTLQHQQANERSNRLNEGTNKKKKKNRDASAAASTLLTNENQQHDQELLLALTFINDRQVLIVRGDADRVAFERVNYRDAETGAFIPVIELHKKQTGALFNAEDSASTTGLTDMSRSKRKGDVTVLATSSAPLTNTQSVVDSHKKLKLSQHDVAAATSTSSSTAAASSSSSSSASSSLSIVQKTLAERLAEMEKRAGTFAGDLRVVTNKAVGAAASSSAVNEQSLVPKAGSLQTLLTQALHTNDDALFEYCLSSSMAGANTTMINPAATTLPFLITTDVHSSQQTQNMAATIQRLPAAYVLPLLYKLTNLLQARPSRAATLLTWIHSLLLTHTPYLLQQPTQVLAAPFSALMSLLEHRVVAMKKMAKLQGKLEIMMALIAQTGRQKGYRDGELAEESRAGPLTQYIEGVGQVDTRALTHHAPPVTSSDHASTHKKRRRRRGAHAAAAAVAAQVEERQEPAAADFDAEDDEEGRMNGLNGLSAPMDEDEEDDI